MTSEDRSTSELRTRSDYEAAMRRVAHLRETGEVPANNTELAELEAMISRCAARPGFPAAEKGRPGGGSGQTM